MQAPVTDQEAERIIGLMNRVDPKLHRFIMRRMAESPSIGLSIAVNMATTLMTIAILIIERSGGDVENFFKILMEQVREKYEVAKKEADREIH